MNKKIVLGIALGGAAFAASAYVGSAWYVGKRIETQMQTAIQDLMKSSPMLRVSDVAVKRGLFGTEHEMTIGLNPDCLGGAADAGSDAAKFDDFKIRLRHTISHGPIVFAGGMQAGAGTYEGTIVLDEKTAQEVSKVLGNQQLLSWRGTLAFDGGYRAQIASPGFDVKEDGNHIVWAGVTGSMQGNIHDKRYQIALQAPKMTLDSVNKASGKPMQALLENIQLAAEGREGQSKLGIGWATVGFDKLEITGAENDDAMSFSKLVYRVDLKESGEFLNVDAGYRLGEFNLAGSTPIKLGPLALEIAFERLHAKTLAALSDSVNQVVCSNVDQKEKFQEALGQWKGYAATLLQNDPVFRLKQLKVGNSSGDVDISGKIALAGFQPKMLDDLVSAMSELPQVINIEINGSASEKLLLSLASEGAVAKTRRQMKSENLGELPAEQAALLQAEAEQTFRDQLQLVAAQNYVKQEGDRLSVSFTFSKGQASLNGQPVPLPFLPGRQPDAVSVASEEK